MRLALTLWRLAVLALATGLMWFGSRLFRHSRALAPKVPPVDPLSQWRVDWVWRQSVLDARRLNLVRLDMVLFLALREGRTDATPKELQ